MQNLEINKGWKSVKELFVAMNKSLNYVVLRNVEDISDSFSPPIHGDIDILVENLEEAVKLMRAKKIYDESYRVAYEVLVANKKVPFDIRFVGDDYYCRKWECDILKKRRWNGYVYVIDDVNHYFSLLYHAYVQKFSVAGDYPSKLMHLAVWNNISYTNENIQCIRQLDKYIHQNGYRYVIPKDRTVGFNLENLRCSRYYLQIKIIVFFNKLLRKLQKYI